MSIPDPHISARRMGSEGEILVVVEDFHPDPYALVAEACGRVFERKGPWYPGLRASLSAVRLAPCRELLAEVLRGAFGHGVGSRLEAADYSLVTTPPGDLAPVQRLPHFDGVDPGRVALLHYLCGPEQGGTAFFRQQKTGYETVTADRAEAYEAALADDVAAVGGVPEGYFAQGCGFSRIDAVEARFNRAVLYRGVTLHSGEITQGFAFSPDPRAGRLTVNSFFMPR